VKSVDNAPHCAEQADEWGDCGGDGQPGNVALQARDFFGSSDLHAALHHGQAAEYCVRSGHLALVFQESAFEDADQRAGAELIGHAGDILQTLGFAEGAKEASALHAGAAQQAPLGEDDGPGNEAESQQR
jgi:hypothetical protein